MSEKLIDSTENAKDSRNDRPWWQRQPRLVALLIGLAITAGAALTYQQQNKEDNNKSYSQFLADMEQGNVKKIRLIPNFIGTTAEIELKKGKTYPASLPTISLEAANEYVAKGVTVEFDRNDNFDYRSLMSAVFMLIMVAYLLFMMYQQFPIPLPFKKKRTVSKVRFSDVAGAEEAKNNLVEMVEYLRDPKRYKDMGAKFPKGVVLYGPPGNGKTLLAKAVAGESGAAFIDATGSDFGSMFVSVSQMKVKRKFKEAMSMAPCILFIDEIDSIGGTRLEESSAVAREMSSTLTELLVQMDGFAANSGVIVIAATNRLGTLDPALLRSGRFDRKIHVGKPNLGERVEILKIHSRNIPLAPDFNFEEVSKITTGFSGADLANLMNQAAMLAVQENKPQVSFDDAVRGRDLMLMGEAKKSSVKLFDDSTKRLLAYHETGHAVVAMALGPDPVTAISIIPRGASLGQTFMAPEKDRQVIDNHELKARMSILVAGRMAEEMFCGRMTTGADDDIARATEIALNYVGVHGMSQLGLLAVTPRSSDQMLHQVEQEARKIIEQACIDARTVLMLHNKLVEKMAQQLCDKEELKRADLEPYEAELCPQRKVATAA